MKKLLLPVLLLCAACGGNRTELPVLDVRKSYPAKNVVLQDIAEVEYVPLETGDGFLVDNPACRYMDDDILILANHAGEIMTFDRRTGKGLSSFNRIGRGPGEYVGVGSIAVDRERNEMFVTPSMLTSDAFPIYVYDLEGKHLRTLPFHDLGFTSVFHVFDREHLLTQNNDLSDPAPFKLLSKIDTLATTLPIALEGREHMSVSRTTENARMSTGFRVFPLAKTADGYVISETGVDTLYRWNKSSGALTPLMTRTPAFHSMEYPVGVSYQAESRDYLFLKTVERKYDWDAREGFKTVNLIYDKTDGKFYEGTMINGDFTDERAVAPMNDLGLPAGSLVAALQPYELLELYEAGKLRGRLAEIAASGLKDNDNPVLMIATLK